MNAATTDLLSPGGTVAGPDGGTQAPDAVTTRTRSGARLFWERFREDKAALAALIVIGILILIAIAGGPLAAWITGHGNNAGFGDVNQHGPTTLDEFGLPKGPNSRSGSARTVRGATSSSARCTARARRCSSASSPP